MHVARFQKLDTYMDVVVIGEGPAGNSAAITCLQAGLRVAMLRKRNIVRKDTLINESVGPIVSNILNGLGAESVIPRSSIAEYTNITSNGIEVTLSDDTRLDGTGHHISKAAFNQVLNEHAIRHGVEVVSTDGSFRLQKHGRRYNIMLSDGRKLQASYFIDATGIKAVIARMMMFQSRKYSPNLFCWSGDTVGITDRVWCRLSTSFTVEADGWTWLAPHQPNCCTWTRLTGQKLSTYPPPNEFLSYHTIGPKAANVTWRLFRPIATDGIILAGDAAGIIDPAAGQGIQYALWSGKIAAETVIKIFSGEARESKLLEMYDDWFVHQYELRTQRLEEHYRNLNIIFKN